MNGVVVTYAPVVPTHTPADCDRELRADRRHDPNRCDRLPEFDCPCGRTWVHICDEAEGCFYAEASP